MSKNQLSGIFSNPIIKNLASSTFLSYLESTGNDGIYIFKDAKGEISVKEFSVNPSEEIGELSKLVELQTAEIKRIKSIIVNNQTNKND